MIEPLKTKYRTEKQVVLDDEKNEGKDPMKDDMETKVITKKVKLNHQLAKVLAIGDGIKEPRIKVGDVVMYDVNSMRESDLIKGTGLITDHNILGVIPN